MTTDQSGLWLCGILAAAISVSVFDYALDRRFQEARQREHAAIIRDDGPAPNRYRVLVPFAMEPIIRMVAVQTGYAPAFRYVYAVFYATALFAMLGALLRYLREWFSQQEALIVVLLTACTLPMALRYHDFAPWSPLEAVLFTILLTALAKDREGWLLPLTLIASLNRETGLLFPLAALVVAQPRPAPRRVVMATLSFAVSLAVLVGLRWWRGYAPSVVSVGAVWAMNISRQGVKTFVPAIVLLLGGTGWVLMARGFRWSPRFVRRTTWLAVVYVPMYLVFGYWYEVRLLMTLYAVALPLIAAGLFRRGAPVATA